MTYKLTGAEDIKIPLTPSQLIVLLQVYRGLAVEPLIVTEEHGGTAAIRNLLKKGLIAYDGVHTVTPKGVARVLEALGEAE